MTEDQAAGLTREVWPEAEGFEQTVGGWTYRMGGGYAGVRDTGEVAEDPQGLRAHAQQWVRHEPLTRQP
ncbi:hypothetical protein [Streptomyces sp. NPDC094049]|uniref:hypothetical protein n=1 Tax=Streptomyces sp. NPDC094049 TaxID=3154987 RepID=UPI0033184CDC